MGYVRTDDEIQNVLDDRIVYQRDEHGRMRQRPIVSGEERATALTIASGSALQIVAAASGVVVAIVGIAGVARQELASIATLAVSFALLAQGSTMAARWQHALHIAGSERSEAVGISTEVFGGLAGLALGVLALVDVEPNQVLPAAAIVIGAAMLLGGPAQPELAEATPAGAPRRWHVTRRAARSTGGVMVMAGVAAVALGILSLIEGGPVFVLTAVAMLCVGAALVLAGGSLAARFAARYA